MLPVESTSSLEDIMEGLFPPFRQLEESQVSAPVHAAGMSAHTLNLGIEEAGGREIHGSVSFR